MIDVEAINALEDIIKRGDTAEVKVEAGKVVVVALGKRKIAYKSPARMRWSQEAAADG